jgi:hypothetical protein
MIGQDVKDGNIVNNLEEKTMTTEEKNRVLALLKRSWDAFHKYVVYALITCLFGIYIGITVSKVYYKEKMADSIILGGFVFEKKGYNIIPK